MTTIKKCVQYFRSNSFISTKVVQKYINQLCRRYPILKYMKQVLSNNHLSIFMYYILIPLFTKNSKIFHTHTNSLYQFNTIRMANTTTSQKHSIIVDGIICRQHILLELYYYILIVTACTRYVIYHAHPRNYVIMPTVEKVYNCLVNCTKVNVK